MEDSIRIAANNLRRIRNERGLTQDELSSLSGVAVSTIMDAESGKKEMKIVTLMKLCEALKVTSNDILYEDVNKKVISYSEDIRKALKFTACVSDMVRDL